ncbi:MAG: XRE family transcriptional regulator [Caldilineaceae bacterium]|nr:XRE family transcriptional regulator [Caldilineaceae bacterium]
MPDSFAASQFGPLLRDLRRRGHMTQRDLAAAVGFSEGQISRLEKGLRRPDPTMVANAFVPALGLAEEPELARRLVEASARESGMTTPVEPLSSLLPPPSSESPRGNLPAPPTPLLGRDREIDLLAARMVGHMGRLITLTGPPGIGKTRLALAVAWRLAPLYPDGAFFIPLAAIDDPALLAATIAGELALPDDAHKNADARLIAHLRRRRLLLLLDNFEQIIAAAPLVADLLAACPALAILATSRERLHLRAEQRFNVPPLAQEAAQELFVSRIRDMNPEFAIRPEDQAYLAEICTRLDCLPLALELSAAQSDTHSLNEICHGLRNRPLDMLRGGPRDGQVTLRGTIRRSYELLSAAEQQLFRRLGVFIGGFQADALAFFGFEHDLLRRLLAKSLLIRTGESFGAQRFVLLDSLRYFALEELARAQEATRARQDHAAYMQAAVDAAVAAQSGADRKAALDRLEAEIYNLRNALRFLLDTEPEAAMRLAGDLGDFWYVRGYNSEGRAWLAQVLQRSVGGERRAYALLAAGRLAMAQSDYAEAHAFLDEAEFIFGTLGDERGLARLLHVRGWLYRERAEATLALDCFRRCIAIAHRLGETSLNIEALTSLATALDASGGSPAEIERRLDEALFLLRESEDDEARAFVLARGGTYRMVRGEQAEAVAMLTESAEIFHTLGFKREEAWALEELGEAHFLLRETEAAAGVWRAAHALFVELGETLGLMLLEHHAGHLWRGRGRPDLAAACYGRGLVHFYATHHERMIARCLAGLGCAAWEEAQAERALILLAAAGAGLAAYPSFLPPGELESYARALAAARRAWHGEQAAADHPQILLNKRSSDELIDYALAGVAVTAEPTALSAAFA